MINKILLNMLIRQIENETITIDDIKSEEYKTEVEKMLDPQVEKMKMADIDDIKSEEYKTEVEKMLDPQVEKMKMADI